MSHCDVEPGVDPPKGCGGGGGGGCNLPKILENFFEKLD